MAVCTDTPLDGTRDRARFEFWTPWAVDNEKQIRKAEYQGL